MPGKCPTLKIKSIHDLAGARIVIEGSRRDQDAVRDSVVAAFAACPKPPIVKDRRETPSHGYRAVHVIVFPEDIPVEIQIRTLWQDRWAQVTESLGDNWGRGLRYGDGPDEPDALAGSGFAPSLTRARVVELWTESSDVLDRMERMDLEVAEFQRLSGSGQLVDAGKLADAQRRFDENRGAWQALVTELGYGHIVAQDVSEGQS